MFSLIKNNLKQYGNIAKNSLFLTVVDGVKLLLPFIAMPYIIRVCGVENYGRIIFAQTVVMYFWALVNFNMQIFAVKQIAENIGNTVVISKIMSSFLALRVIFTITGGLVLVLIGARMPIFRELFRLLMFAYIMVIAEAFTVTAFFQGIEKMYNISLIQLLAVFFYLTTLFAFVHSPQDYELVVLLQSVGLLLAALIGVWVMCVKYCIKLRLPSRQDLKDMLWGSVPFAIAKFAAMINLNIAKLFAGMVLGMHQLALLDMAQKITDAALIPAGIIEQAIYPHNAQKKDRKFISATFWLLLFFAVVCAGIMVVCTPLAVDFFGAGKLNDAIPIIYFLSLKVAISILDCYIGVPVLVALGYSKPFNDSIIYSTAAIVVLYVVFYLTGILSMNMFILLITLGSFFTFAYRMFYCIKYKLLFSRQSSDS